MDEFKVYRFGLLNYQNALNLQLSFLEKRMKGEIEDVLLLLQHPPTFTMGSTGKTKHLLLNIEEIKRRGIHFETSNRGGDVTYHGPGQLVGYPIVDLNKFDRDINHFLRSIEEMIICTLSDFQIKAQRIKGLTGVWVNEEKVASIGVGIKKWVTYHGFALNVNTDLSYFDMIVPCGIQGARMTSIKKLRGNIEDIDIMEVESSIINAFSSVFNRLLTSNIASEDIFLAS